MKPYLNDIDSSLNNIFSCVVNSEGGSTIAAYILEIYNTSNTKIYTTNKITLQKPLYNGSILEINIPNTSTMQNGKDYYWNISLFENRPSMWVAYGSVITGSTATIVKIRKHYNVKTNMYIKIGDEIRKITLFNKETGDATVETAFTAAPTAGQEYTIYSDFITSADSFFKCRKTPTVAITNLPTSSLNSRTYEFIGSYAQENNVEWRNFMWNLYNENNELVETTGKINTGDIKYRFDGLSDNTTYKIELVVENQNDIITKSPLSSFYVDYLEPVILNRPQGEVLSDKDAIHLFWEQPIINLGSVVDVATEESASYDLVKNIPIDGRNSIHLKQGTKLFYVPATSTENVDIPYINTTFCFIGLADLYRGNVIKIENTIDGSYYIVTYRNGFLYYDINTIYVGGLKLEKFIVNNYGDFNTDNIDSVLSKIFLKIILLPTKIILDGIIIQE